MWMVSFIQYHPNKGAQKRLLNFYYKLGKILLRIRWLLWITLIASAIGFAVLLLSANGIRGDTLFVLPLLTGLWALCALAIQMTFTGAIPALEANDSLLTRTKKRLGLAIRWILAISVTGVTFAVLLTTYRVLNTSG